MPATEAPHPKTEIEPSDSDIDATPGFKLAFDILFSIIRQSDQQTLCSWALVSKSTHLWATRQLYTRPILPEWSLENALAFHKGVRTVMEEATSNEYRCVMETLEIYGHSGIWLGFFAEWRPSMQVFLRGLHTLQIGFGARPSLFEAMKSVACFPSIQHLEVLNAHWNALPFDTVLPASLRILHLTHMTIEENAPFPFAGQLPNLTDLSLSWIDHREGANTAHLGSLAVESLTRIWNIQRLALNWGCLWSTDPIALIVGLPRLQELKWDGLVYSVICHELYGEESVLELFDTPHPELRLLDLVIYCNSFDAIGIVAARAVSGCLAPKVNTLELCCQNARREGQEDWVLVEARLGYSPSAQRWRDRGYQVDVETDDISVYNPARVTMKISKQSPI